ncbi:serine--tRNA ligase [Candidatus Undinarchaeota archaeon]
MKFELKGSLTLTKPIEKKVIEPLIKEANKTIMKKGASAGNGSKVDSFSISGKELKLEISSDRYVRAHDGMLRLRKFIAEKIGREHKVGIRDVKIAEYKISFDVESAPEKDLKFPLVDKISFSGKKCTVLLKKIDEEFLQKNYIDRIINLVNEKTQPDYGGKTEHWELLWQSGKKKHVWDNDPTVEMEKLGWIQRTKSRGQWIFGPTPSKLMRVMEQIVLEEVIIPMGFSEMFFPKLVTWDVWAKSGHAKGIYPEAYYVCPPQTRDADFWEEVSDHFKITGEVDTKTIKTKIKEPIGGMCYAQCPPFWPYVDGKTLAKENLPLKVFDRSGTSMRYEGGGIHGIERVDEFHRIEIVWMGTPEQTAKIHQEMHDRFQDIFKNILDIEARTAWVTPWFLAQEGSTKLADDKKKIGTIDFEAYMPYRGSREDSEWLEFQNASNNGPKYPDAFNVKAQGNPDLWSGCVGVGLERWLAVFTAQKGLDPKNWPESFKKRFGKMPDALNFL